MEIVDDEQVDEMCGDSEIEEPKDVMDLLEETEDEIEELEVTVQVQGSRQVAQYVEQVEEPDEDDWTFASPATNARYQAAVDDIQATFKDEIDEFDMTMVSEYAEDIFSYMGKLEVGVEL